MLVVALSFEAKSLTTSSPAPAAKDKAPLTVTTSSCKITRSAPASVKIDISPLVSSVLPVISTTSAPEDSDKVVPPLPDFRRVALIVTAEAPAPISSNRSAIAAVNEPAITKVSSAPSKAPRSIITSPVVLVIEPLAGRVTRSLPPPD